MERWSIRVRLTIWYSLVLLAGLAMFGGGVWFVVSHSLIASLDDSLTAGPGAFRPLSRLNTSPQNRVTWARN